MYNIALLNPFRVLLLHPLSQGTRVCRVPWAVECNAVGVFMFTSNDLVEVDNRQISKYLSFVNTIWTTAFQLQSEFVLCTFEETRSKWREPHVERCDFVKAD